MSGRLRCYSFHSVKGGVGKSTLSIATAFGLAQRHGAHVTLLDMDLTGTSLADVLPLEAPGWPDRPDTDEASALDLLTKPSSFHPLKDTRTRMARRDEEARRLADTEPEKEEPAGEVVLETRGVPFLNDYLLFATPSWDEQRDVPPESLYWRVAGHEDLPLRVIPSSALPADLERILPVIFDEAHSGFLENRLEYLLDAMVPSEGEHIIVVDTPPTIPGLSRSVLSLALRLSAHPKRPLSEQGGMPPRLAEAEVSWTAFLVATEDHQDLRAANRWLSLVKDEERPHFKFLINRVNNWDPVQLKAQLKTVLQEESDVLVEDALFVKDQPELQFFRGETAPTISKEAISFLGTEET